MPVQIPILKVGVVLIASIQIALDDRSVSEFQRSLLQRVANEGQSGVIIDVSAADVVDSFMARSLNDIDVAVHLLGARLVIVGVQPAVAITLVSMGLSMPNAIMALNLERGLDALRELSTADPNGTPGSNGPVSAGDEE